MDRDLHRPDGDRVTAAAIVVHPHPGMGGDRHHPLVVAVAEGLARRGFAALRIDLPDPDTAASAVALEHAAGDLRADTGATRLALVGYSWGSVVGSIASPAGLQARVLVAPPVSMLTPEGHDGTPTLVLVPAHDQYGGPAAVADTMGGRPATTIEVVEGADHFLAGAIDRIASRTVEWLTGRAELQ